MQLSASWSKDLLGVDEVEALCIIWELISAKEPAPGTVKEGGKILCNGDRKRNENEPSTP